MRFRSACLFLSPLPPVSSCSCSCFPCPSFCILRMHIKLGMKKMLLGSAYMSFSGPPVLGPPPPSPSCSCHHFPLDPHCSLRAPCTACHCRRSCLYPAASGGRLRASGFRSNIILRCRAPQQAALALHLPSAPELN